MRQGGAPFLTPTAPRAVGKAMIGEPRALLLRDQESLRYRPAPFRHPTAHAISRLPSAASPLPSAPMPSAARPQPPAASSCNQPSAISRHPPSISRQPPAVRPLAPAAAISRAPHYANRFDNRAAPAYLALPAAARKPPGGRAAPKAFPKFHSARMSARRRINAPCEVPRIGRRQPPNAPVAVATTRQHSVRTPTAHSTSVVSTRR